MSGPSLDKEKLGRALNTEGVVLEADAYFICRRNDWMPTHSLKYGAPPDTREIDVLAVKEFELEMIGESTMHHFLLPIECKHAVNWWVFTDLSRIPPHDTDFSFSPGGRGGVADQVAEFVIGSLRPEHFKDEPEPARAAATAEFTFGYGKAKRDQFYTASRQVLSSTKLDLIQQGTFSTQMRHLVLYVPVVLTNQDLILATIEEGADAFDLDERDWLVAGNRDDIVHVVTPKGLDRLLRFLNAVVEGLRSPAAQEKMHDLSRRRRVGSR